MVILLALALLLVLGCLVLSVILFIKVWRMCNDVNQIALMLTKHIQSQNTLQ